MSQRNNWRFPSVVEEVRRIPVRHITNEPDAGRTEQENVASIHPPGEPRFEPRGEEEPEGFTVRDRRWWAQPETEREVKEEPENAAARRPAELEAEVNRLRALVDEKDRHAREAEVRARQAADELERAKERISRQADKELEQRKRAILETFLEVLDDLDRALFAASGSVRDTGFVHGVELVRKELVAKLAQFQVTPMSSANQPFDPSKHEAVTLIPVTDPALDAMVMGIIREGYWIDGEILRPARVAVGKLQC